MKLKKYEGLSSYLIAEDGSVFNLDGSAVEITKGKRLLIASMAFNPSCYKLKTDEIVNGSNIVRRYSREDIQKLYNHPKSVRCEVTHVMGTEPSETVISGIEEASEVTPEQFDHLKSKVNKPFTDEMAKKIQGKFKGMNETLGNIIEKRMKITSKIRTPKEQKKLVKKGGKKPVKSVHNQIKDLSAIAQEKGYVKPIQERHTSEMYNEEVDQATVVAYEQGIKPPFFVISGVPFRSARAASKDCGISVNTVLKRCKANKDGYFYIEK